MTILLLFFGAFAPVFAKNNHQAEAFITAYEALSKGELYSSDHLKGYLLHPYLEYQRIKQNLKATSTQTLAQFVNQNRDSWLGDDINTELLLRFAKQKQWRHLLNYYRAGKGGIKAKCVGLEAQLRTQATQALWTQGRDLWISANRRPDVCNPLFRLLKQKGLITDAVAWQRISLAMNKGRTSLAHDLRNNLKEPSLVALWTKLRKNPSKHIQNKRLKKGDSKSLDLLAYAVKRIGRKNNTKARQQWQTLQKQYRFSAATKADVNSNLAVRDAKNHARGALKTLAAIPTQYRSEDANLWLARLAIRFGDWHTVRAAINSMSTENQQKDRWRYWAAHSRQRLGDKSARQQLKAIAQNASFYGFLAADELNLPYVRLQQAERNWRADMPQITQIHAIQRATELFAIGLPKLAKKEWRWAMQGLSKDEQLIAAAYALEINQPFQAIITVSGTKDWNQTGLRFPLKYKNLLLKYARKHGIRPDWAYAIMRRESAFDPLIVSSANAQGLMQVLPKTAKSVAKKLKIKNHRTADLFVPEKNINIGTGYLSQMLKRFNGNMVKATAAYNAGPGRIPRWLPQRTISAPRWIESIPFDETRNYVRAVMSYATIYDYKLHHHQGTNLRLSQRLQAIGPK